jgi:hypothetical protein
MTLAVIAISIPSLKSTFERILRNYGLISTARPGGSEIDGNILRHTRTRAQSLHFLGDDLQDSTGPKVNTEETLTADGASENSKVEKLRTHVPKHIVEERERVSWDKVEP